MEAFALYLIKSAVWLTGFALVYLLFLRNERFFLLNRIYLVSGILVSIVFPFFTWHYTVMLPAAPKIEVSELQMVGIADLSEPFPTQAILLYIYLAGALYLLFRIIRQTLAVLRVIRKSDILPYRSAKLIRTTEYPASFSFFSFVFVNPSTCDIETNEIVNHEMEHIRQRHWVDLLLFEILCIIQWFNPLSWLYGRFIRQNQEYLADERALQRCSNPGIYRAALLNQMFGGPVISLANSFNYSLNKKRFNMMKQTIYSPIRKLKLLLVLPIMAGVFYAFGTPEYTYAPTAQEEILTILDTRTITGKVVDGKGDPLKGASVIISGTTIGTVTDGNGNFKLELTDDSPLVISYVGFQTVKLSPDLEKEMLIVLKNAMIGVDEVTVTGTALTENHKIQTIFQSKFRNADGSQGQPLIVIDGVVTDNQNTNNIPPETIESISVLKNEFAINKYGDKGKNGVVEIILKKGASSSKNQDGSQVYTMVEEMPEFPGGDAALRQFIATSVKYPALARENGIQGKVYVSFVVTKTGSVANAKVVRGDELSLAQEALRVVNSLPPWKPGKQNGENVATEYTIPINFVLEAKNPEAAKTEDTPVFFIVEEMPEFPGGDEALRKFIADNVKYPAVATQKGIQGKVFINFVVTKTGNVTNAKVARGVDESLDQEAIRVVNLLPTWKPGKQKGQNVDVSYTIPINFVLEPSKISSEKFKEANNPSDKVFMEVEIMPEFPGGDEALRNFIASNVKYPAEAQKNGIQGKVFINFVVTKTGNVTNAKVVRGVDASLDQEAIRVVNLLPTWTPGKQKGENVSVSYTLPINFVLKKETKKVVKPQTDPSAQKNKLIIVPNPAQSMATVTLEGSESTNKLEVSIFNSHGKLLSKESKNGPSFSLAVSNLATGTYLVVATDGTTQYQGQMVVNH